jgi:hypothetical protein
MLAAAAVIYLTACLAYRRGRSDTPVVRVTAATRAPSLDTAEHAALASLAVRYAHGDPAPGRQLANYLRLKLPGVSDVEIMRAVRALSGVARHYLRVSDSEAGALAAYLYALGSAALELTEIERDEIPR